MFRRGSGSGFNGGSSPFLEPEVTESSTIWLFSGGEANRYDGLFGRWFVMRARKGGVPRSITGIGPVVSSFRIWNRAS